MHLALSPGWELLPREQYEGEQRPGKKAGPADKRVGLDWNGPMRQRYSESSRWWSKEEKQGHNPATGAPGTRGK